MYIDAEARLDVADVHEQVRWYQDKGLVDAAVDPARIIDTAFLPALPGSERVAAPRAGAPGMRLEVRQVGHRFDDLTVLEGIELPVEAGEVLALIGPSGCGKSTLLSILGGLLRPSSGEVLREGELPEGCLVPMTYVFQDFALLPWRSVAGNVRLVLEDQPLAPAERDTRVAEVLALTGLSEFRAAYPKQLSGGMRQRLGIARALAVRPGVLLMDEPLSALDAQTRSLLLEEFAALFARTRATAVYVTHNLSEALRLADRVAVLSRRPGRLKDLLPIPVPVAERRAGRSGFGRGRGPALGR